MALFLGQIARPGTRTLLLDEYARLPILLNVVLHALVLRSVLLLLEVLLLAENLVCQSDLVSSCRSVGDLLWLVLFVPLKEESRIHIDLYVRLAVIYTITFVIWPVAVNVLLVCKASSVDPGDIFVIASCHELFQIQLVCLRHFRSFLQVAPIRREVWVLANDALIDTTFDILVRVLVL